MSEAPLPPIAVIADAHVHDPAADLGFPGATAAGGLSVRPLAEAARSTRVFNESLAAFRTALDGIAARGIRHVVLLGDYTDDGQRATTASVARILDDYGRRFGLEFFATPGNHDVFADRGRHRTKRFLTAAGTSEVVTSRPVPDGGGLPVTVSAAMACHGVPDGVAAMRAHGYCPKPSHRHWETPFGMDAESQSRTYAVSSASGATTRRLMDASYLVEPAEGLWLLMIDANVFVPVDGGADFADSTSAGWNAMLTHKRFVIDWMADVAARAKTLSKRLVAFSHYPALDPLDGTRLGETALLGATETVGRLPLPAVGRAMIEAGIAVHLSGHLHVNDTARLRHDGRFLVNIAVPSLVGFPSAYKILSFGKTRIDVETVTLDDMPLDPAIRRLYAAEIRRTGVDTGGMAEAERLGDFLSAHLGHIAWRRHLKREWPVPLAQLMRVATLDDLAAIAGLAGPVAPDRALAALRGDAASGTLAGFSAEERRTMRNIGAIAFLGDWYRVRMGSDLGLRRIGPERLGLYRRVAALYRGESAHIFSENAQSAQALLARVFDLFERYTGGLPSADFSVDLDTGDIAAR